MRLQTTHAPLHAIEKVILENVHVIESWFRLQFQKTPAPLTSSVDLRHSGFKITPVDTNLFPAGFNNLAPSFLPLCVQAAQAVMSNYLPKCKNILLLPESHTRNKFYLQSLAVLQTIFINAGFVVRIGSLDPDISAAQIITTEIGDICLEPLLREGKLVKLEGFEPCIILLNNDLSAGVPLILDGVEQRIQPTHKLGWSFRLKSSHFQFFDEVALELAKLINIDPWLINPYFEPVSGIDFMKQEGLANLVVKAGELFVKIAVKYAEYGIKEKPFLVVKADNGTYGMSVMMIDSPEKLYLLSRKQRTRMSTSKGGRKVESVLLQEGVHTLETMSDGAFAEPVVYMIGQFVVGGFYRVHSARGRDENLNSPGMHFKPLAFKIACNMPGTNKLFAESESESESEPNRFYAYGVVARMAALAAGREIAAIKGSI